jgi:hypothetical protein
MMNGGGVQLGLRDAKRIMWACLFMVMVVPLTIYSLIREGL